MRFIQKNDEPRSLREYRAMPRAVYDGPNFTPVKSDIRQQLLREQGYLCCYCMKRIEDNELKTKIEHWHCQDTYPNEQLAYQNLLAACDGNSGSPPKEQHCDTKKTNHDVSYNPSNANHKNRLQIQYSSSGEVISVDPVFNQDIENILNLNFSRLRDNRKIILDTVAKVLNEKAGTRTRHEIQRLIVKWSSPDHEGKLPEYCDVALYYLNRKLLKTP